MYFYQAMRQFQFRVGRENFCLIFVSLVPVLGSVGEQKTKPTQHGVKGASFHLPSYTHFPKYYIFMKECRILGGLSRQLEISETAAALVSEMDVCVGLCVG
jgi:hypothetical protein